MSVALRDRELLVFVEIYLSLNHQMINEVFKTRFNLLLADLKALEAQTCSR